MTFGSRSLTVHLLRGALGGAGIFAAVHWGDSRPWLLFVLLPLVLLVLRGCPTCWLVGLCETVATRTPRLPHRQPADEAAATHHCAGTEQLGPGAPIR